MKVYVVAIGYYDGDTSVLGVYRDKENAKKCFIDCLLYCYGDRTIDDLTEEELAGIEDCNYLADGFNIIIQECEIE